ncbi:MAG: formimidoylglutamate deiminase, partial [Gammaproteobacteria bacterium]|nr:formimidoylglutamate deiminase [Gammaproteobacteria bacterium]
MTRHYLLDCVLLPRGWTQGALVSVTEDGCISAIQTPEAAAAAPAPLPESDRVTGFIVPGMANAHSHAFQRGMTGNTEYRLSARDSFWTWRQAMYALANRIEPDDLRTLATQLFIEMLKAGYTSVAEFHYLHRQPNGELYADGNGLWDAVIQAAATAGIGLTLLPTLYQTSDFGAAPLKREQARFALDTEWFLRAIERRIGAERRHAAATLRTGAAFHSLRAVPLATLCEATLALRAMDATLPLHIHVAEQVKEVESCLLATGRRPIELLLDTGLLNEQWCLVHATHATGAELKGVAASGAGVCVSISTEANLGDG